MTSRNVVRLFFSTLLIGGIVTAITGICVRWNEFAPYFSHFNFLKISSIFFWLFGVGLIFSLVSQVAFFSYLTVNQFGLSIFRSATLWNGVQVILIIFALFDLVYFRYKKFSTNGSLIEYIIPALFILLVGAAVAYVKVRKTNKSAFISAVFFMTVVTIIEWMPVLHLNDENWLYLMLFPLLVCNAFQLLILHKLNEKSKQEKFLKMNNSVYKN